ncbi:uncharacterized protein PAC_10378 [Phialocephala subalpina]|uniref:Uncharacterized protein n=1 Tax=Phialocephala subalpina TaxID=576137 RepID=A0A1L7X631_9HELO|nr:uncharacterized protein PAC_10378 [Phialocephala subalpina]
MGAVLYVLAYLCLFTIGLSWSWLPVQRTVNTCLLSEVEQNAATNLQILILTHCSPVQPIIENISSTNTAKPHKLKSNGKTVARAHCRWKEDGEALWTQRERIRGITGSPRCHSMMLSSRSSTSHPETVNKEQLDEDARKLQEWIDYQNVKENWKKSNGDDDD